jgi:hypothetical protein
MTTVLANTIRHSNLNAPAIARARLASAWGCANQVGVQALRSSFGVASITDWAVGVTYFNVSPPFSSGSYCSVVNSHRIVSWIKNGDTAANLPRSATIMYIAHVENNVYSDTDLVDCVSMGALA